MSRLIVCYEQDLPSLNMKKQLMGRLQWDDMGTDGTNSYMSSGNDVLMTIDRMHVHAENVDRTAEGFGIKVDEMVVLSRHSSASGKPTLTVHPIGNYRANDMGGKAETLVRPTPHLMTSVLRNIPRFNKDPSYSISFEVTHHGPYVDVPTMYLEIGSDESHWGDEVAAGVLIDSLLSAEVSDYPVVIGIGGGHYAPRFTDLALSTKVDIGHMVPNYQINDASDEEVSRMISSAAEVTDTDLVYVHRNSMKGPEERRVNGIIDSLGLERVSSKDFDSM
ncbi:MAG: D-aminoacyl-tRNA deacylase [Candidatus Methanomethylophilaceae archaeon]|nr:D-aminoacyl-tRNA deacylase [Candidatus Methanomethylophilaceae archaeon]